MASIVDEDYFKVTMTIDKVTALIQSKHTSMSLQRHHKAVRKITQLNKDGFLLHELSDLCRLLTILAEKLECNVDYEEPLVNVVKLCSKPFLKERTSHGQKYSTDVVKVLSLLGKLCWSCHSDRVKYEIARTVGLMFEGNVILSSKDLLNGFQQVDHTYQIIHIEKSNLSASLLLSLQYTSNIDTRISLLETLVLLSSTSSRNCDSILLVGGAKLIAEEFISFNDRRVVYIAVELLWNLLEYGSQIQVSKQVSSSASIRALQTLFNQVMTSSFKMEDKQFRNDVQTVVTLVAMKCDNAPFVETQFLKDICRFATFSELEPSRTSLSDKSKLTRDEVDFDLKQGLLCLLVKLSSFNAAPKVFSAEMVIPALLQFAVPNDTQDTQWNSSQFEELQLLVLSCLCTLGPMCIDDYMTCQGNTKLLLLIEWCTKETGFRAHGNSFHGTGGRNTKYSQLCYSLKLLLSMTNTEDAWILQDLHEQGIIPLLLGILKSFEIIPGNCDKPLLLKIQIDTLLILSRVCGNHIHCKELFGGYDGAAVVVKYLKLDTSKSLIDETIYHKLLKATIDCIWSAIIGHGLVEDMFLEQSGVFGLLDVLHICHDISIRSPTLSVIVDLCESNHKSVAHVQAWSAKGGINIWSVIAQIWRDEEKKLGVPREKGTLVGTTLPLVGLAQSAQGTPSLPTNNITPAIEDVSGNLRAKVYALYTKIGPHRPTKRPLSAEDKVTFCIIENYLDFKTCEVWYEVASELANDKMRPLSPDQECLQEIFHFSEERAEEITRQQHDIIDEKHRQDLDEEYEYYEQLREAQFSNERAQEKEAKLISRTSNYERLQEAKKSQTMAIEASRPSAVSLGERFHATNQSSLNVTTFCGRYVTVATSPIKILSGSNDMMTAKSPPTSSS